MRVVIVLVLLCSAYAKDRQYPLIGHVVSCEGVHGRRLSAVSNISTGEVTGTSWSGSNHSRIELRIAEKTYILSGHYEPTVGIDLPARLDNQHVELLVTDKKGKSRAYRFSIEGAKE